MPKSIIILVLAALLLSACGVSNTLPTESAPAASVVATGESSTNPPTTTTSTVVPVSGLPTSSTGSTDLTPSCTVKSQVPAPNPTIVSLFPEITQKDWVLGPFDAPITVMEYSDYQ